MLPLRPSVVVFVLLTGTGTALFAQNASLSGFVRDPAKTAVPKAAVEATSVDTAVKITTMTNDSGIYSFASLQPGRYEIAVKAPGFQSENRQGITLEVAQPATLDFTMKIGETREAATVS